MIKAVLFDMDGTLLPMDFDTFIKAYFSELAKTMSSNGYDPDTLIKGIWRGTGAMMKNAGSQTNEEIFWKIFSESMGKQVLSDKPLFDKFYANEFDNVRISCGFDVDAARAVKISKELFGTVALASNPIFPIFAQKKRGEWAGVDVSLFDYVSGYENSHYSKPTLGYYSEIADELGVKCDECLMVGNDVDQDMCAEELGMKVFLITRDLINSNNKDITQYNRGSLADLCDYLHTLT